MNSFLITGGNYQKRLEKANKKLKAKGLKIKANSPDILLLKPDPSIGIKQIRDLQKFLSRRPYQAKIKATIIAEAEKITFPAQNAFLKTLEEPPANNLIILCAPTQENLLPTIISRCQLIKLKPKPQIEVDKSLITNLSASGQDHQSLISRIAKAGPGQRLQLIEPHTKNREEAIRFCQEMIIVLRYKGIARHAQHIAKFQHFLQLLTSNVNVKLVMENLAINL